MGSIFNINLGYISQTALMPLIQIKKGQKCIRALIGGGVVTDVNSFKDCIQEILAMCNS